MQLIRPELMFLQKFLLSQSLTSEWKQTIKISLLGWMHGSDYCFSHVHHICLHWISLAILLTNHSISWGFSSAVLFPHSINCRLHSASAQRQTVCYHAVQFELSYHPPSAPICAIGVYPSIPPSEFSFAGTQAHSLFLFWRKEYLKIHGLKCFFLDYLLCMRTFFFHNGQF